MDNRTFLALPPPAPLSRAAEARIMGCGQVLSAQLNQKLAKIALELMVRALDADDYECCAIMEYALRGASTCHLSMGDLADRVIEMQRLARACGDKKMLRILQAAIRNGAR